jgi:hypothetical protein
MTDARKELADKIDEIILAYADSYLSMSKDGDGKVLALSVRADLRNNISPAIIRVLPNASPGAAVREALEGVLIEEIISDIIRPGWGPEERTCYELADQLRNWQKNRVGVRR